MSFSFLCVSFPNFQLLFSSCEGYKLANAVEQIKKNELHFLVNRRCCSTICN
eukprot:14366.XXX_184339_184494_1 [CDS] Oithona nana genome sequencing.